MLTLNLPSQCPQFRKRKGGLFFVGRLAMPLKTPFRKINSLTRNRVRDDYRRLAKFRLRCLDHIVDVIEIMSVYFQHMPVERFEFCTERFEGHNVFGKSANLNIVAVDNT